MLTTHEIVPLLSSNAYSNPVQLCLHVYVPLRYINLNWPSGHESTHFLTPDCSVVGDFSVGHVDTQDGVWSVLTSIYSVDEQAICTQDGSCKPTSTQILSPVHDAVLTHWILPLSKVNCCCPLGQSSPSATANIANNELYARIVGRMFRWLLYFAPRFGI